MSVRATTCRGRTTTRCASCEWKGSLFGDVPMDLELRLSVEDSPNSAGVVIDMIRCCKLAPARMASGGVLEAPSAYFCKHPPVQYTDDDAYEMIENFIRSDAWKLQRSRLT